jgi:flagellar basal body rod protein FlgB
MKVLPLVSDNVTELLVKIVDFTIARHRVLSDNLANVHTPDYVPMDLAVEEFAALMETAILEHTRSKRLLLRDTDSIKFGVHGSVHLDPLVDEHACMLIKTDPNEYLEYTLKCLSENSLNQKVAAELLRQKQGIGTFGIDEAIC